MGCISSQWVGKAEPDIVDTQRSFLGTEFPRLLRVHKPLTKYIKAESCPLKQDPGQQMSVVHEIFKSEQHGSPDLGAGSHVKKAKS